VSNVSGKQGFMQGLITHLVRYIHPNGLTPLMDHASRCVVLTPQSYRQKALLDKRRLLPMSRFS